MYRTQCVLALVALFLGLAHSWDIAVTAGDRIEFYTDGTKTNTISLDSQNLTAIVYDEVHDKLLYVNKQSNKDAICAYDISSVKYQCYVERYGGHIQGLAFDPITEMLFFTDTKDRSINWVSFKQGSVNNDSGNLLIKMAAEIPTDIAVDSSRGYIYWINTNRPTSTIERARLNGSGRENVIIASYSWDLHSLVIDQQTQKLYWVTPKSILESYISNADLNGKNKQLLVRYYVPLGYKTYVIHPNTLTISKESLFLVSWCSTCRSRKVWKYSIVTGTIKPVDYRYNRLFEVRTESAVSIAANYKISEQIQGVQAYKALTSLTSLEIAREHVNPFCVHGIKVSGQSLCKCTPGYIGKRCDVSVCENYCLQGDCSFNDEGLPKCRCNAGYSGEKCEVNANAGGRCEVPDCRNYCLQGECSFNAEGLLKCRCNAGYSGERCEVNACHGYCLNNGTCTSNTENEPVCQCIDDYAGDRCEVSPCLNYCLQGVCRLNEEGVPVCRCNAGYNGERCEVNVCHGYCMNNGTCFLNEEDQPFCQCVDDYAARLDSMIFGRFTELHVSGVTR